MSLTNKTKIYKRSYDHLERWGELIKIYARSQQDFPKGLGLWRSVAIKTKYVGRTPLYYVPPVTLTQIVSTIIDKYKSLKKRFDKGEKILPDIRRIEIVKFG